MLEPNQVIDMSLLWDNSDLHARPDYLKIKTFLPQMHLSTAHGLLIVREPEMFKGIPRVST